MSLNNKKIVDYNRQAWNNEVEHGNTWTIPVTCEQVAAARQGNWHILLTPTKLVPADWYPQPLQGKDVLCLASGGGQQGPIMAAAGAHVTVFDNSDRQLAGDRMVADRDGLVIHTVQGDMADLSIFPDASFDLIIHPVSNLFIADIRPVWKEACRVLRTGGSLLSGFCNPVTYIFDYPSYEKGEFVVRYKLPYSDETDLPEDQYKTHVENGEPSEFGHMLTDQIGGQIDAGFVICGFYEDYTPDDLFSAYVPQFMATRAVKLSKLE